MLIMIIASLSAMVLSYRCNKDENIILRVLYIIIAGLLAEYYIIFYIFYHIICKIPCSVSFAKAGIMVKI